MLDTHNAPRPPVWARNQKDEILKAARIHRYGDPEVFQIDDIPPPAVGPRDVLVEVHAASVNPVDWKIRQGYQRGVIRYKLPVVLGLDVSGVVVEVGGRVTKFRPGDEVYSSPTHRRQGTYAEFVAIDERQLAHKPKNFSHQEAASIPLVGLTAWEALCNKGKLQAGQRALIQAGAGGVGTIAIQIAKGLGATVITTCSERNIELVKALGADQVINYHEEAFDEVLSELDYVLDALGGDYKHRARKILRKGGILASIVGDLPAHAKRHGPTLGAVVAFLKMFSFDISSRLVWGIRSTNVLRNASGDDLAELTRWCEENKIRAQIDRVYPLEEIAQAHQHSQEGHARGKIIIAVKA